MFVSVLSFYQVTVEFLDFVFSFGESERARDSCFGGFRVENRFSNDPNGERALAVPALGRSGRQFLMCFNLRSIEWTEHDSRRSYSIRQTAVYHSFDLETGRSVWIFFKGNDLIQQRIRNHRYGNAKAESNGKDSVEAVVAAFRISLDVHTILCDWAQENWRRYINFLEQTFRDRTQWLLHVPVDNDNWLRPEIFAAPAPPYTEPTAIRRRTSVASLDRPKFGNVKLKRSLSAGWSWVSSEALQAGAGRDSSESDLEDTQLHPAPAPYTINPSKDKEFLFHLFQFVQSLEEEVNETRLVLEANMQVLRALKDRYMRFRESEGWPDELKTRANDRLTGFESRLAETISGLGTEKSRLEALANLIFGRKTLVSV